MCAHVRRSVPISKLFNRDVLVQVYVKIDMIHFELLEAHCCILPTRKVVHKRVEIVLTALTRARSYCDLRSCGVGSVRTMRSRRDSNLFRLIEVLVSGVVMVLSY